MNQDILYSICLVLTAIGFFAWGMCVRTKQVQQWRMRWIDLEHDSAKAEKRVARNINDVFPKG